MKPVRECLNELPEPYKTQALENFDSPINGWKNEEDECKSGRDAIHIAFDWADSPQGWHYWNNAINKV